MVKLKIVLHLSMGGFLNPLVEFAPNRSIHDYARLCGIPLGHQSRDRPPAPGAMGGIFEGEAEELLKSYNKNALITAAIHACDRL